MVQHEIAWPTSSSASTVLSSTMTDSDTSVYHFHTPATLGPGSGTIGISEAGSAVIQRKGALNFTPGDLTTSVGPPDQSNVFDGDTNPICGFLGQPKPGHGGGNHHFVLSPNTDYYLNATNLNGSGGVVVTLAINDI